MPLLLAQGSGSGFLKHTFLVVIDVETTNTGLKKDDKEHKAINQLRSGHQRRSEGRYQIDNLNQHSSRTRRTRGAMKLIFRVEEAV